ncbi:glutamyl-tRNA reductase [Candidatus Sumerlaeota bacterium]|nr:glutamyl-tRNA reductase [Candidatus Sumerlaeota bacterium]
MEILLVGLNHTTAPVEVRERLALSDEAVPQALKHLRESLGAREACLLSTCNRTEVLFAWRSGEELDWPRVVDALCEEREVRPVPDNGHFYAQRNEGAVRHLLRVAAGLDSMVLGEGQILGQVRQAYALARDAEAIGPHLGKAMQIAFRAGKRVRAETELGYGAVSVAYVAVVLARKVFGEFDWHTALVIGAGEMAESAARHLREQGIGSLLFANRTREKAERLALEFDGDTVAFADLLAALERADVVVSSTGSPHAILTLDEFRPVHEKRHTRPMFLVDLAVPRDLDPAIADLSNVFLYDVDGLREVADDNLARRRAAVPLAESIVDQELDAFRRWRENLRVEPLVKRLHERFDEIRRNEVTRNLKRFRDGDAQDVENLTQSIQKKILHRPAEVLRRYDPDTEEGRLAIEIVREIFGLD